MLKYLKGLIMKHLTIIFILLFFTACTAKYKVVKEYIPPKESEESQICISLCQTKKTACQDKCKAEFEVCKIKADRVAQENYENEMKFYTAKLENYVNNMSNINISYMYDPFFYDPFYDHHSIFWGGYPYYYDPYYPRAMFYNYAPIRSKPKKPSLEREKLKAQMKLCNIDCGCRNEYDGCFRGCGGIISHKKICIENCPD